MKARRQDRIFVWGFALAFGLTILAASVMMARTWLGERALSFASVGELLGWSQKEVNASLPPLPIPLAGLVPNPLHIERHVLRKPQDICAFVKEIGFDTEGWVKSAVNAKEWECMAFYEIKTEEKTIASAFLSMRGSHFDKIDKMRLKFNLPSDNEGRKAYAMKISDKTLIPLFDFFCWTFPEDLKEHIRNLEPFETDMDGVHIRLFEEFDSNQRIHLLLTLPKNPLPFIKNNGHMLARFIDRKDLNEPKIKLQRIISYKRASNNGSSLLIRDSNGILIPEESYGAEITEPLLPDEDIEESAKEDSPVLLEHEKTEPAAEIKPERSSETDEPEDLSSSDSEASAPTGLPAMAKPTNMQSEAAEETISRETERLPVEPISENAPVIAQKSEFQNQDQMTPPSTQKGVLLPKSKAKIEVPKIITFAPTLTSKEISSYPALVYQESRSSVYSTFVKTDPSQTVERDEDVLLSQNDEGEDQVGDEASAHKDTTAQQSVSPRIRLEDGLKAIMDTSSAPDQFSQ